MPAPSCCSLPSMCARGTERTPTLPVHTATHLACRLLNTDCVRLLGCAANKHPSPDHVSLLHAPILNLSAAQHCPQVLAGATRQLARFEFASMCLDNERSAHAQTRGMCGDLEEKVRLQNEAHARRQVCGVPIGRCERVMSFFVTFPKMSLLSLFRKGARQEAGVVHQW